MEKEIYGLWITKDGGETWSLATYKDIEEYNNNKNIYINSLNSFYYGYEK